MKITILTLFPEYFAPLITTSILKRAIDAGKLEIETINFRDFTLQKHGHVDDAPYGGGAGQVLMCQPVLDALKAVRNEKSKVILLSPQGQVFKQPLAASLAEEEHLIFICGHYEGFDERIRDYADLQVSLGDFVLTGGEPAAAVMVDAIARLCTGVIRKESAEDDSFSNGLLEYPQYTRPEVYDGKRVPEVLLSGHHANIEKWRRRQSVLNTAKNRPDLLENAGLSEEEKILADSVLKNQ